MAKAISVRHVTKNYGEGHTTLRVLDDVDLDVDRGELVLLMGPSGSGKTTLLSIIGCILRPTSGVVRILGREVSSLDERDLPHVRLEHVGFVFQGFNLFPALTASQNIELVLHLKGRSRREGRHRAAALLDRVGLATKRDVLPADLSGGQKQRVAIARALASEPSIILADEPTAALDLHSGLSVIRLLRDLAHQRGRAVVLVTHDGRILEFADRVVRIEDGRIVGQEDARSREEPL
ncbi:MAG TPA: ABC transporter ATP-binding protein [Vicinamibacterales bacterium]|nr:ABC transporter ATP-binding protein [Vicinamibacterales bacterium]